MRTALAALLLAACVAAPVHAQNAWTLTVFEPDGGGSLATTALADVDDAGRAVGRTWIGGQSVAFEWTVAEGLAVLPPNALGSPSAGRINTQGDMIVPFLSPAAVLLADGSMPELLNPFGTTTSVAAYDIADGPVVVGRMAGTGTTSSIMIWEPDTGTRSIFVPSASFLRRVSNGPWAVGNAQPIEGSSNGFRVNMDTEASVSFNQLLPGGAWSEVADVNELGVVTGQASSGTTSAAITWSDADGFTFLPGLEGGPPEYVLPRAIDNAGRVVGQAFDANLDWRAFLWDPATGMLDLNDVVSAGDFELLEATDISETGLVIGRGQHGPAWGPPRGFLLQPPGPWSDLGQALAGAAGAPTLVGEGTLLPATWFALTLTGAPAGKSGAWIVGLAPLGAPFFGGTLVPHPTLLLPLVTDADGRVDLDHQSWPGMPAGTSLYFQAWVEDPAGPAGYAASNALRVDG